MQSKLPNWVTKHKIPNSEIRHRNGKYYLYRITSKWCPEKKRTKKVTEAYLGSITEEYGLIPPHKKKKGPIPKGESPFKENIKEKLEPNFLDTVTEKINDTRSTRNRLYTFAEILLLGLFGILAGAEGWKDIQDYGKAKLNYLQQYLSYENGIPSDDTIRRFFSSLDSEKFSTLFREWLQKLAFSINVDVISIDGKASRHSFDSDQKMLHTVSAFANDARIVLGQQKVDDKSNEITAIPKLLNWLDIAPVKL